jgi:antitoxin component YwqK of YwqJK toxin-antitoxin module
MNKKLFNSGIILLLLSISINAKSENIIIKIYFDNNWMVCKNDKATYYRICSWDTVGNFYDGEFSDYLINNIKINQGTYETGKKKGIFNFYYETGSLKTNAFFKDDKPDSIWNWYYPTNQLHFKIFFEKDDFKIVALNDVDGKSILETPAEFIFGFQNDTINTNMEIKGTIRNKEKDDDWSILLDGKPIAIDTYRRGKYLKSIVIDVNPPSTNQRIINNLLFVPFSISACEELRLNEEISELDYPFLSYRFPWQPIEVAVGLVGDSSLYQIDKKPLYIGGMEAIYKTIGLNLNLTGNAVCYAKNWGWLYYEITIDENGTIIDKNILKSPDILFNDIALSALNYLGKFRPAYHNGHAIKSKISSRILFQKKTNF